METELSSEDNAQIEKFIPSQVFKLREILKGQHNIIVPVHCDEFLARCIRTENGNVDDAIKLVKAYYNATGNFPNWDATFEPTRGIESYQQGHLMVISQRDPEGRIVTIGRVGMWDPEKLTFDQAVAGAWMLFQYITAISKDTQRRGIVTIWDFAVVSMKLLWATHKWKIPYIIKLVQSHTVGTINEFHAINHPKVFHIFFATFIKPFLRDWPQKWIFFHDNLESLHSCFDKNGLPTFLDGNQEINECMDWKLMNEFLRQDQYFTDMMNDRFPRY